MRRAATLILSATLVGAGCGGDGGRDRDEGEIRYVRSGGLAPIVEKLEIEPDARARLVIGTGPNTRRTRFELPGHELDSIRASLEDGGFVELPERVAAACADCYRHVITYGGHTVDRASSAIPPELEPVLDHLHEIVAAHRPPVPRPRDGG